MNVYCAECGEGFRPVEYREQPAGTDEPQFCSNDCEDVHADREEFTALFWSAGEAAPVFP